MFVNKNTTPAIKIYKVLSAASFQQGNTEQLSMSHKESIKRHPGKVMNLPSASENNGNQHGLFQPERKQK